MLNSFNIIKTIKNDSFCLIRTSWIQFQNGIWVQYDRKVKWLPSYDSFQRNQSLKSTIIKTVSQWLTRSMNTKNSSMKMITSSVTIRIPSILSKRHLTLADFNFFLIDRVVSLRKKEG